MIEMTLLCMIQPTFNFTAILAYIFVILFMQLRKPPIKLHEKGSNQLLGSIIDTKVLFHALNIWNYCRLQRWPKSGNGVTLANFCPMEYHTEVTQFEMEVVLFKKKLDSDVLVSSCQCTKQKIEKN